MSSCNQGYEVGSGRSPWVPQEDLRWYALHTRARHEKTVERRLRDQGMETFVPTTVEVHRWSDRKKKVEVPLFSCYVFIRCALSAEDRTHVYQVESVHGFVGVRGASLPIPDGQIEGIRKVLTPVGTLAFVPLSQGRAAGPGTGWSDGRSGRRVFVGERRSQPDHFRRCDSAVDGRAHRWVRRRADLTSSRPEEKSNHKN